MCVMDSLAENKSKQLSGWLIVAQTQNKAHKKVIKGYFNELLHFLGKCKLAVHMGVFYPAPKSNQLTLRQVLIHGSNCFQSTPWAKYNTQYLLSSQTDVTIPLSCFSKDEFLADIYNSGYANTATTATLTVSQLQGGRFQSIWLVCLKRQHDRKARSFLKSSKLLSRWKHGDFKNTHINLQGYQQESGLKIFLGAMAFFYVVMCMVHLWGTVERWLELTVSTCIGAPICHTRS